MKGKKDALDVRSTILGICGLVFVISGFILYFGYQFAGEAPNEGISAGKIAKETRLSMRRTYKYLRGLKGKKLVFIRRTPKAYGLTCKGEMLASVLQELQQIVDETWSFSQQVINSNDNA